MNDAAPPGAVFVYARRSCPKSGRLDTDTAFGASQGMAHASAVALVRAAIVIAVCVGVGLGLAVAASEHVVVVAGAAVPVLVVVAAVCFVVNWLAFVAAAVLHTERFYDLTGSITFITATTTTLLLSPTTPTPRALAAAAMVLVWTLRLGSFLVRRVFADGGDGRFDEMKHSPPRFVIAWTLQGLWVFLTALPAFIAMSSSSGADVDVAFVVGAVVWGAGFAVEVVADHQKRVFRRHPENRGRFIHTGLWAYSRHPNYFGEITLWVGVTIMSSSTFVGWQWLALISPVFVAVLLTRISGIPLLVERAEARFGTDPEYRTYVASTSLLVPWPRRR